MADSLADIQMPSCSYGVGDGVTDQVMRKASCPVLAVHANRK